MRERRPGRGGRSNLKVWKVSELSVSGSRFFGKPEEEKALEPGRLSEVLWRLGWR